MKILPTSTLRRATPRLIESNNEPLGSVSSFPLSFSLLFSLSSMLLVLFKSSSPSSIEGFLLLKGSSSKSSALCSGSVSISSSLGPVWGESVSKLGWLGPKEGRLIKFRLFEPKLKTRGWVVEVVEEEEEEEPSSTGKGFELVEGEFSISEFWVCGVSVRLFWTGTGYLKVFDLLMVGLNNLFYLVFFEKKKEKGK